MADSLDYDKIAIVNLMLIIGITACLIIKQNLCNALQAGIQIWQSRFA